MLEELDINKHNFSKIGKYISNKLHHIQTHKSARNLITIQLAATARLKDKKQNQSTKDLTKKIVKKNDNY